MRPLLLQPTANTIALCVIANRIQHDKSGRPWALSFVLICAPCTFSAWEPKQVKGKARNQPRVKRFWSLWGHTQRTQVVHGLCEKSNLGTSVKFVDFVADTPFFTPFSPHTLSHTSFSTHLFYYTCFTAHLTSHLFHRTPHRTPLLLHISPYTSLSINLFHNGPLSLHTSSRTSSCLACTLQCARFLNTWKGTCMLVIVYVPQRHCNLEFVVCND